MTKFSKFIGLDVHKETIAVGIAGTRPRATLQESTDTSLAGSRSVEPPPISRSRVCRGWARLMRYFRLTIGLLSPSAPRKRYNRSVVFPTSIRQAVQSSRR